MFEPGASKACCLIINLETGGPLKGRNCGRDNSGGPGDRDESHRKAGSSQRKHPFRDCTPPTFPHCWRSESDILQLGNAWRATRHGTSARAADAPEEPSMTKSSQQARVLDRSRPALNIGRLCLRRRSLSWRPEWREMPP